MTHTAVSVIIPSYNGQELLKNNLPKVIKQLRNHDELIVIDDKSYDDTLKWLLDDYQLQLKTTKKDKYGEYVIYESKLDSGLIFKLISNNDNLRFAASCNRGAAVAQKPLLFLMNSDVELTANTINSLIKKFEQNNINNLFAVGCLETEPNEGNISGGKNKLWFEKGIFQHQRADDYESGSTGWVSGGSGMFDRDKWHQLGGFDLSYYPAYWEDIDLSQRAKKKGWNIQFCSESKVIHNHQTTNKTVFKQNQLQQISWKNADKFSWKHSSVQQKLEFILFRPYWWWQRWKSLSTKSYRIGLILILLLAATLRFFKLAQVPAGMTWDEAAIGYNGYSVVQTRRDEWLEKLPISFRSFGDYKAPLAIYLVGIFTSIIDLNLWVLRLPFAISGVLGVWGMVVLTKKLLPIHLDLSESSNQGWIEKMGLIAGLILATSPWHLHFSRTGFESGLALTFILWGVSFLLKYLQQSAIPKYLTRIKPLFAGIVLLVLSMYTYHSPKLFVPLIGFTLVAVHLKLIKKRVIDLTSSLVLLLTLLGPMIYDSVSGNGLTRAGSLSVLEASSFHEAMKMILVRFTAHLSPGFLIGGWTDTLRHGATKDSVFLLTIFILMIVGLIGLLIDSIKKRAISPWLKLSLIWIILGLLPAVLGDSYPQANRALLALPGFVWLAVAGFRYSVIWLNSRIKIVSLNQKILTYAILFLIAINTGCYLKHYYQVFAFESAAAFNEGYLEAMQLAYQYEQGREDKPEVSKIIVSNQYGQAYIYALFVRKTNPIWYQGGSLNKYLFVDKIMVADFEQPNTLIIDSGDDHIQQNPAHQVVSQGGEIRFLIYYTGEM